MARVPTGPMAQSPAREAVSPPRDDELQRLAFEARGYQEAGGALQQQLAILSQSIGESHGTLESLRALVGATGKSALTPLGSGTLLKARFEHPDRVLMDVGGGVVLEKALGDAVGLLERRLVEYESAHTRLQKDLESIAARLRDVDARAAGLMAGRKEV